MDALEVQSSQADARILARPSTVGSGLLFEVVGKFDWSLSAQFSKLYRQNHSDVQSYLVDLSKCTELSPCAVCALMLLEEYSSHQQSSMKLTNLKPDLSRQLKVADPKAQLSRCLA